MKKMKFNKAFALCLSAVMAVGIATVPSKAAEGDEGENVAGIEANAPEFEEEAETQIDVDSDAEVVEEVEESVNVSSGTCGTNVTWSLSDDGTLTISGSGAMDNYFDNSPFNKEKSAVRKVVIEEGVTSIGNEAFYSCSNIWSVSIPNSVTSIGNSAFELCENLTDINIPNSITSIGTYAFCACNSLRSIEIPNSVTSIKRGAFMQSGLRTISIPNSVEEIEEDIFYECTQLKSVDIPNSVTSIGSCAFWYCTELENISIPSSVTSIGEAAFGDCGNLRSITIPYGVKSIGRSAFAECFSLVKVDIPSSVTSIGADAFSTCTQLENVSIPKSVKLIDNGTFEFCYKLKNVVIQNGVESISAYAFYSSGLENITIPSSVKSIGNYAIPKNKNVTIHGKTSSEAHSYAVDNNIKFEETDGHDYISGTCQMPYDGEGGGYLIGVASKPVTPSNYTCELLVLDCNLYLQGLPAWIYQSGKCNFYEGGMWTVWQPKYGYFWTLFRIYDEQGNIVDEVCYGFANI